jgi:hypothetical protein
MVLVQCPNPICSHIFEAQGFRPITFECPVCRMRAAWWKKGPSTQGRGVIGWRSTREAVEWTYEALTGYDTFLMRIFTKSYVRWMLEMVADAHVDDPPYR